MQYCMRFFSADQNEAISIKGYAHEIVNCIGYMGSTVRKDELSTGVCSLVRVPQRPMGPQISDLKFIYISSLP